MKQARCFGGGPRRLLAFNDSLCKLMLVMSILLGASCKSQPVSTETEASGALTAFWSNADQSVHGVQRSLRSARQVARQIGGEATTGNYEEVIAVGHRLGGLGHDHATPADNVPVVQMLDSMLASIDSLLQVASTGAELEEASAATDANVSQLSLRSQRLYHLLSAKKQANAVRRGALTIGFRPSP